MYYKLVVCHKICQGAKFQPFLFSRLATRGLWISQKCQKPKKIKITSSLFIIYLHNVLQTCSMSWNLSGSEISAISIFTFGHQGASNCQKSRKTQKIKIMSSLFIIYLHNVLQTCSMSWNSKFKMAAITQGRGIYSRSAPGNRPGLGKHY